MPFEKSGFQPRTMPKEEFFAEAQVLTEQELRTLGVGEKDKKPPSEKFDPLLTASFKNPETATEREISFDIEKELAFFEAFYQKNLGLGLDRSEIISIWKQNYQEIQKEVEIYGYNTLLIVPDTLPGEEVLNETLIESMKEKVGGKKVKVAGTYQSDNFKNGGSFAGVRNPEKPQYCIILTHSDQNIYDNPDANPFLKATLGKNIQGLSGLNDAEIQSRITQNLDIPVHFEANIRGQTRQVMAEGLSLKEYEIFQRVFFEKNGKHLDEMGWTWLIRSFSGPRVVFSSWFLDDRRLFVFADVPGCADGLLGLRLSRSFKKLS